MERWLSTDGINFNQSLGGRSTGVGDSWVEVTLDKPPTCSEHLAVGQRSPPAELFRLEGHLGRPGRAGARSTPTHRWL